MRTAVLMATVILAVSSFGRPTAADENSERAALKEKAQAHLRESQELKQAGKHDAAREHFEKAQAILRELGGGERERDQAVQEKRAAAEREAGALKRRIAELREAGKAEEAEKVEGELKRLMAALREHAEQRDQPRRERAQAERAEREGAARRDSPRRDPDQEHAQRVRHLHEAAEHLRAAGLNQMADEVLHHARGDREGQRSPERRAEAARHEVSPEVRELREHVQQLHAQMEEIRQVLRRLAERKD